ncbi:thiamine-phosphate kinase [Virgibacillus pantothenticus]|uniref:thiamine-phosphate kinase n=1 Tax=Virgibacillus pantothenticus TaxID=1473 RepID=UPI00098421DD|nr:thiamine-phosphate kinase [Virgibacillus pantothenticus]
MDEFTFIDTIKQNSYRQSSLIKGIGDDAAVFRQNTMDIVTAVDTFVEGIHFRKDTMSAFHIGYRALAANISDLAAMGSQPAFYLASIVIPRHWSSQEVQHIFQGMKEIATHYSMDLIGGDTVSGNELVLSITVMGYVAKEQVRYRGHAEIDDVVFVTGTLGDSQAGYHILTNKMEYKDAAYFIERHRMPTPRVAFAACIPGNIRVALNDVSDGIANEAAEIATASKVSIQLHDEAIPVHDSFSQFSKEDQQQWKYFGGEDFELIGTVAPKNWEILVALAKQLNLPLTQIGKVFFETNHNYVYIQKGNHQLERLLKQGYNHLK